MLTAGERRSFTANTIIRDPAWRKQDAGGALRINPDDAARLGVAPATALRVTTARARPRRVVEVSDTMQPGHIALPNGLGLDYPTATATAVTGVAPNELTSLQDRDWLVGTPWHKYVPARLERVFSRVVLLLRTVLIYSLGHGRILPPLHRDPH